jgi:hypothetical protein
MMALIATAGMPQIEPSARAATLPAAAPADEAAPDPLWNLGAATVERIGYRKGKRQAVEVVPLGPTEVEVEINTARAFLAMREAAATAGVDLRIESGFRTVEQQRALFLAWRAGHGNKAARPGQSNHQSGRALDIAVHAPGALAWLETNASSFRFARTVANEPWHWEYEDAPVARGAAKRVWRKPANKTKGAKGAKVAGKAAKRPSRTKSIRVASIRR